MGIAESELKKTRTMKKMKLLFVRFSLLFGLAVTVSAYKCNVEDTKYQGRILNCIDISDVDLPMQLDEFAGHYDGMSLRGNPGIYVPEAAFNGVTFDKLAMIMGVESIDENFLTPDQQSNVTHMEFRNFRMEHFPWATVASLTKLEGFTYSQSGLTTVEENIPWPKSVRNIDLGYNVNLTLIKSNAFKSASGLISLSMWSSSSMIVFEEKSLYTTASNPTFSFYFYGNNISSPMFADDAFGNVAGGNLWDTITMKTSEFREETFRPMLKAAFDKNADHLFEGNFGTGPISLDGCMDDCTYAWIYKDAKKYGMREYGKLIGGWETPTQTVNCKDILGYDWSVPIIPYYPVYTSMYAELYAHFESCPGNPLPWPKNYCQEVPTTIDVIVDPDSCRCFYHCSYGQIAGNSCCPSGLVFNPDIKACDWPYNVPNCV